MMVGRFVSALLLACALGGCETAPPQAGPADLYGPPEKPAPVATPSISAERMSEITRVLASDDFQGRSMGTAGEEKTAWFSRHGSTASHASPVSQRAADNP